MRTVMMLLITLPLAALAQQDSGGASAAGPRVDTTVIGSQEAPSVTNIVPWKDKSVETKKRKPTSFLRDRVLQPLDREVLMREVEYYRMLNNQNEGDDLFLE